MFIKIPFNEVGELAKIAMMTGSAPCQILSTNNARFETELIGREISVRIEIARLVRSVGLHYKNEDGNVVIVI